MAALQRRLFLSGMSSSSALIPILSLSGHAPGKTDLSQMDGLAMAELVRKRKISPRELLEYSIERIESLNPQLNAIAHRFYDQARHTIKNELVTGPFTGVPFLTKDLSFDISNRPAEYGSRLFKGHVAAGDSTIVTRLRKAGLVLVASTRVPEFGLLPTTESVLGGITRNPWSLRHTAGGSSGGSASAVAAGMAPMAGASDGGGSIRIPASCCGLFGFKPTRGRTPLGPNRFETWGGLGVVHAVTKSVRDSAALLDATAGPETGDAYTTARSKRSYLRQLQTTPPKLRVALVTTMSPAPEPSLDCLKALTGASQLLRSFGHHVEDATAEFNGLFSFAELRMAHGKMVLVELRRQILRRLADLKRGLNEDDLEPVTRFYFDTAAMYTGVETQNARDAFHTSSRVMARFMQDYDVVLTPTLAKPPIEHQQITLTGWAKDVADGLVAFNPCTALANWTGQPAMSVPFSISDNGLPIGIHFFGRLANEALLFQLANQIEKARPWSGDYPTTPRP